MTEQYVKINNFSKYEISNLGNVRNIKSKRSLKPRASGNGYYYVGLTNDNGIKDLSIHRLVAIHFIPTSNLSLTVNHKDGNKKNNIVTNLEWVTQKENMRHAAANGMLGIKVRNNYTGMIYNSFADLARSLGVTKQAVQSGISKGRKSYSEYSILSKKAV